VILFPHSRSRTVICRIQRVEHVQRELNDAEHDRGDVSNESGKEHWAQPQTRNYRYCWLVAAVSGTRATKMLWFHVALRPSAKNLEAGSDDTETRGWRSPDQKHTNITAAAHVTPTMLHILIIYNDKFGRCRELELHSKCSNGESDLSAFHSAF